MAFTIWLDGDAAPRPVKDIVFRACLRRGVRVVMVANRPQRVPRGVEFAKVDHGLDVADEYIVKNCQPGDLVITADIPLAAEVVDREAVALQPRGEVLDSTNVRERLSVRDFMDEMRAGGLAGGGPPPFGQKDRQRFADSFDRILSTRASR